MMALRVLVAVLTGLSVTQAAGPTHKSPGPALSQDGPPTVSPEGWYDCFEDKCVCNGVVADCSKNYGRLDFVPKLPAEITTLNFSANSLTQIPDNFFANVTSINSLDLSSNAVMKIGFGAFHVFQNLTTVLINHNLAPLFHATEPLLSVTTLRRLELVHGSIFNAVTDFLRLDRLEVLDLSENLLLSTDKDKGVTPFAPLKFLRDLGLRGTSVDEQVSAVLGIEKLDLGTNGLTRFLQTCNGTGTFFPNLQYLDLTHNLLLFIPCDICLPKLQFLDLSQNAFTALLKDSFSLSKFPSLVELHLDSLGYGTSLLQIARLTFNNPTLRLLSLAGNTVRLSSTAVDPDAFSGCWNLSTLLLYRNDFTALTDTKVQRLFGVLPRLSVLDLRACKISSITNQTFVGPSSLQRLLLSYNYLSHVPDHAFDALFSLTELDLSANRLSMITERTFSEETRGRLRHLDVSNNNFTCGCEIRWFRQWLISDPSLFNGSNGPYACSNNVNLISFYMSDQACMFAEEVYKQLFGASAVMLSGLVLALACSSWRLRWPVRPLLQRVFRIRTDRRNDRRLVDDEENFQYDVFVSYAEEDDDWVRDHLMPELEGRLGLRLCVHQRDFHPGRNILDNIEDCLESSKKAMMIFSTHFARSQWCQFELSLGLRHVMDRDDELLIVYLHDVAPRDLTAGMAAMMRTCTYLRWSQRAEELTNFWNSLRMALRDLNDY